MKSVRTVLSRTIRIILVLAPALLGFAALIAATEARERSRLDTGQGGTNMRKIEVRALPDGWRVAVEGVANDIIFRSGGAAEGAARRLARRLARAGESSEIRLYLRDGTLAGRFLSPVLDVPTPEKTSAARLAQEEVAMEA